MDLTNEQNVSNLDTNNKTSKRGRKPKNNKYFDEAVEQAVIDYINTTDQIAKNKIYTEKLHKPITKLVEGIAKKYATNKHIGSCGMDELITRMYLHVYNSIAGFNYTIIGKSGQKVKAYSYLGTIAHNYFKNHSKKVYILESKNDDIQQYNTSYIEEQIKEEHIQTKDHDEKDVIDIIFEKTIKGIKHEIKNNKGLKEFDIKVGNAIVTILENYDYFFNDKDELKPLEYTKRGRIKKTKYTNSYAKNKIIFILKDMCDLDSKEIRKSLNKYKTMYELIKKGIFEN